MKNILTLLFLVCCLELNAESWNMPKQNHLSDVDEDTGHNLDIFYGKPEDSKYQAANDDEIAAECKKTPRRPGCFNKNRHGQAFCEAYKNHHNKDLEGGNCRAKDWNDWKNQTLRVRSIQFLNEGHAKEVCTGFCEARDGTWTGKWSDEDMSSYCYCNYN